MRRKAIKMMVMASLLLCSPVIAQVSLSQQVNRVERITAEQEKRIYLLEKIVSLLEANQSKDHERYDVYHSSLSQQLSSLQRTQDRIKGAHDQTNAYLKVVVTLLGLLATGGSYGTWYFKRLISRPQP